MDDKPYIRKLSSEVLLLSGFHMDSVEDGAIAWEALQLNSYDLLVTDNNMCQLTGIGLVKKLHAARRALPVILMSGALPTEELNSHPELQIDATLLKPFTVEELLGTVTKVLRSTSGANNRIMTMPNQQSRPSAGGLTP